MRRFEDPYFIPGADDESLSEVSGGSDGDVAGPADFVRYTPGGAGQPWLRSPLPPWHLWGNTQVVEAPPNAFTNPNLFEQTITLIRVSYKRPETWRFLFSARIIDATPAGVGEQSNLSVWFELLTGIGRSALRIPFWVTFPTQTWSGGPAPIGEVQWATHAQSSLSTFGITTGPGSVFISQTVTAVMADQVTGQDLTVLAHVNHTSNVPGAVPAHVEINGQLAPNTHVRPDWYQPRAPHEVVFAGAETEGR